jgi:hypothetical protein
MAPEWLQALVPAVWYERYGRRVENYRLPKTGTARLELATAIGADGQRLLAAVDAAWRNIGLAKTHLQHVITAAAVNLVRIADWQSGVEPAKTRCSRFAALQMAA